MNYAQSSMPTVRYGLRPGHIIHELPKILDELGYLTTMAHQMEQRSNSYKRLAPEHSPFERSALIWDQNVDTGDMLLRHPDGTGKIVRYTPQTHKSIATLFRSSPSLHHGKIELSEEAYHKFNGFDLTSDYLAGDHQKGHTIIQAKSSPILNFLAGDSNRLDMYVDALSEMLRSKTALIPLSYGSRPNVPTLTFWRLDDARLNRGSISPTLVHDTGDVSGGWQGRLVVELPRGLEGKLN